MPENERRVLEFADFGEVLSDVENLYANGYEQRGQWDLAQVCDHLAMWVMFSMEGFPRAGLPMRWLLWSIRIFTGRRELRRVLESGTMTPGGPTFRSTVFPAQRDPAEALKRLKRTVTKFESFSGSHHSSPVYGPLTHEQWRRLHLIHCAHHLGFLTSRVVS